MFGNCFSLTYIQISVIIRDKFETILDYMFNNCTNLKIIQFNLVYSGLNISCVKSMKFMFNNCTSLKDSGKVRMQVAAETDLSYMFNNCSSLTYFDLTNKLAFPQEMSHQLIKYEYMFSNCTSLQSIDLSSLTFENNIS